LHSLRDSKCLMSFNGNTRACESQQVPPAGKAEAAAVSTHQVVRRQDLPLHLGHGPQRLQVGKGILHAEGDGGRVVAAHEPRGQGQDALLQAGDGRQPAQLLDGHHGVLREGQGTREHVLHLSCGFAPLPAVPSPSRAPGCRCTQQFPAGPARGSPSLPPAPAPPAQVPQLPALQLPRTANPAPAGTSAGPQRINPSA